MEVITSLVSYLINGISYKKGSLFFASLILSAPTTMGYERIRKIIIQKFDTDDFVINIMVAFLLFFIIFLVVSIDTITGIMKAKAKKEELTPAKGLVSIFKFILYSLFIFIVICFQAIATIYGWVKVDTVLIVTLFTVTFLITLWEFKSIGDNVEEVFGKRFEIFNFVDKIADVIETSIVDRIKGSSFCKPDKKEKE